MHVIRTCLPFAIVLAAMWAGSGSARAQHTFDVIVEQANGQLVTAGYNGANWVVGVRQFTGEFPDDPNNPTPNDWTTNNPGYGAFSGGSANLPSGTQPLPGNPSGTSQYTLYWDFMPMIKNGVAQNVFYWNGKRSDGQYGSSPADVNFGPLPTPNYTLEEADFNGTKFPAHGINAIEEGGKINKTGPDGSLHFHLYFAVLDNDGDSGTSPPDGIYLVAERFRMNSLLNSDPAFIVFDTSNPAMPASVLANAAVPWVAQHINMLTGVPGDFNRSGTVDASDYVLWRKTLGQSGNTVMADWNYNNQVDAGDYTVWRNHFAALPVGGAGESFATVPEPTCVWLLLLGCAMTAGCASRHSYKQFSVRHKS
jgi:hypothetical protein